MSKSHISQQSQASHAEHNKNVEIDRVSNKNSEGKNNRSPSEKLKESNYSVHVKSVSTID